VDMKGPSKGEMSRKNKSSHEVRHGREMKCERETGWSASGGGRHGCLNKNSCAAHMFGIPTYHNTFSRVENDFSRVENAFSRVENDFLAG